jgi:hypothetical protein
VGTRPVRSRGLAPWTAAAVAWPWGGAGMGPPVRHAEVDVTDARCPSRSPSRSNPYGSAKPEASLIRSCVGTIRTAIELFLVGIWCQGPDCGGASTTLNV